jgi:hypothetical protein
VSGRPEVEPALLWILDRPYAAEVLDALATRTGTRAELRAQVHAPRRALAAVHGLAALGAIRCRDSTVAGTSPHRTPLSTS